jgi:serine/threonine-protein kinase PpkA
MPTEELSPEELTSLLTSYMPEIPGYRVIRRIGKGGMSHVYLGVQVSLDRQVAIKVMSPEALTDEKSKARFEQEAHTIAKLEHPCIVGVHEVGRTPQGLLYYVLPYLARGHLGQRDFTQDEPRIVEVLRALLSALEYAHTRGIVHRDVKAENVLFDNADRPLLTDFGIALSRHENSARITTAGLAVGSGGYMAPEQARGEAVDGRADLYSVGVLAYELLMGRLPFLSADPLGLALMHAQDPIPRLPPERRHWQAFIDRAMAKSPDNRFRNAQQMLGALNQVPIRERGAAGEPAPAPTTPASLLLHPWAKPLLSAAVGAAVLLLALRLFDAAPGGDPRPGDDFFTGRDVAPAAPPVASAPAAVAPAPAVVPPAADEANPVATPAEGVEATSDPVAASIEPAPAVPSRSSPLLFAAVEDASIVVPLGYDPSQPGARALHAVAQQIAQTRLSTPADDNAIDSVLAAKAAGADAGAIAEAADRVLAAFADAIPAALKSRRDASAQASHKRAQQFARDTARLGAPAWATLQKREAAAVLPRLESAHAAGDADAITATKALAIALGIAPAALEPAWSRALPVPKPGRVLESSSGPATVLVRPPAGGQPGIAFMRREVSRSEYAQFASATNRGTSRCRNRLAPISIKKRNWSSPGFDQGGDHPAVCISYEDARAYAQWLSQRTGESWRLPTASEWRQIANYRGSGNPCQDGRVDCGPNGTIPASQGPASPLGLTGVRGNAREWLADCAGGCKQHLVAGLGWRDSASRAEPLRSSGFDAGTGFDDTGFRLVREVGPR